MDKIKKTTTVVKCPACHKVIYDGNALKSRITLFNPNPARSLCPQCKSWVEIPQVRRTD